MDKDKLDRVKNLLAEDKEARSEAAVLTRDILYLLQGTIENSGSPKLAKAVAIGSAALTVGTALKGFWGIYKKSHTPKLFTIKITEDDQIFEIVEDWFMDALPEENQRSVYAHSTVTKAVEAGPKRRKRFRSRTDESAYAAIESPAELDRILSGADDPEKDRVTVNYSFDGTMVQTLTIAGYEVEVYTNVPERSGGGGEGAKKSAWDNRSMNIVCKSVEARNAVLEEIEKQSQHLVESQPRMFVTTRWGDWRKRAEIQPRSRESVVLKEGQMDRILDYLNTFLSNKAAYAKADIPFRTGILLHGEPGSGKSSTALAIANELKMNVYIVSLTSLMSDESLSDCFGAIPANSIVILEDIDIVSAVKERDKEDDHGVTMTGMLNVLDGFQSPPGVITIMTTNRLDVLDPAIIRPGRVDLMENLDCLDDSQLKGLCSYFMGTVPEDLPHITPEDGISSAEVMGVVRKHLPDFENAGPDMVKFVEDKLLTKLEEYAKVE
jgi:hypothetical protein